MIRVKSLFNVTSCLKYKNAATAAKGAVILMVKWPFNFLESNHISSPAVSVITREWTATEERGIPPLFISPTLTRSLVITIGG